MITTRSRRVYGWQNRTICDVFAEMREADKTKNYSYLLGLIEEAQSMANRMEAGLGDKKDLEHMSDEKKRLKKELKKLDQEVDSKKDAANG